MRLSQSHTNMLSWIIMVALDWRLERRAWYLALCQLCRVTPHGELEALLLWMRVVLNTHIHVSLIIIIFTPPLPLGNALQRVNAAWPLWRCRSNDLQQLVTQFVTPAPPPAAFVNLPLFLHDAQGQCMHMQDKHAVQQSCMHKQHLSMS